MTLTLRSILSCTAVLGLIVVVSTAGYGQSTATLQGSVSDETTAMIPGVTVTVRNIETGITRDVLTDERGWYHIPALAPGEYELRAELAGFATVIRKGLTLFTEQEATINLTLKPVSF